MTGRCGPRSSKNDNNSNNQHSTLFQPRLKTVKMNADTLSIHDGCDDGYDLLSPAGSSNRQLALNAPTTKKKPGPKPRASSEQLDLNQLLHSIKADTAATRNDITSTRNELKAEMKQLANRNDTKLKSIDAQLAKHSSDIKLLFAKVSEHVKKTPSVATDIELHKQQQIRNNIAISNVPIVPNENLYEIIKSVLSCIGIQGFAVDDLANAKRVQNSKSRLIIASFRDYDMKVAVMKKKLASVIKVSDLFEQDTSAPNPRIYINTQLTPFYSKLSFRGREAISSKLIHSCWVASRGFLVKLNDDSVPVTIATEAQLSEFLTTNKRVVPKKRVRSVDAETSPELLQVAKIPSLRVLKGDPVHEIAVTAGALSLTVDAKSKSSSSSSLSVLSSVNAEMDTEHDSELK